MSEAEGAAEQVIAQDTAAEAKAVSQREVDNAALTGIAEHLDMEDYVAERRDQEIVNSSNDWDNPFVHDAKRRQERSERYARLLERARQDTESVLGRSLQALDQDRAVEERIAAARAQAQWEVRIQQYEAQNPGFLEYVNEVIATHGDVTPEVGQAIRASEFGPEIVAKIVENPDCIAALNQLPPKELERFVWRMEGSIAAQKQLGGGGKPQTPRIVSSAPPPVATVSGKAAPAKKTPEELAEDMDEYAKWWRDRERKRY